jgi:hypothetical protein
LKTLPLFSFGVRCYANRMTSVEIIGLAVVDRVARYA